jgi:hypothetical protein
VDRARLAHEALERKHVIVEPEGTGLGGHVARVGPVGHVDVVLFQQRFHRFAQHDCVMAGERRAEEDGGRA